MDLLSLPYVITFGAYVASPGFLGADNILGSVFLTLLLGAVPGMLNAALPRHPLCDKHGQAAAWRAADRGGGGRRLAVRGLGVKGLPEPRFAG
jgi:hypothetical protein